MKIIIAQNTEDGSQSDLKITGSPAEIKTVIQQLTGDANQICRILKKLSESKRPVHRYELPDLVRKLISRLDEAEDYAANDHSIRDKAESNEPPVEEKPIKKKPDKIQRSEIGKDADKLKQMHKNIYGF